jgi:hypothetical protein
MISTSLTSELRSSQDSTIEPEISVVMYNNSAVSNM